MNLKWQPTEVRKLSGEDHPFILWHLPSGFTGMTIEVLENPIDGISVRYLENKEGTNDNRSIAK